jgi:hypothetical protein
MTIKLVTYARVFYPYIMQTKLPVGIAVYLVVRGDKLLKRSFAEINSYTVEYAPYFSEIDAFTQGLDWIVNNVQYVHKQRLEVVFSGAARTKIKKNMDDKETDHNYDYIRISKLLSAFNAVVYSAQGKIYSDGDGDNIYNLYDFSNKVFEMFYGRDNGYMHQVFDMTDPKYGIIVGEPEMRHRNGFPRTEWS